MIVLGKSNAQDLNKTPYSAAVDPIAQQPPADAFRFFIGVEFSPDEPRVPFAEIQEVIPTIDASKIAMKKDPPRYPDIDADNLPDCEKLPSKNGAPKRLACCVDGNPNYCVWYDGKHDWCLLWRDLLCCFGLSHEIGEECEDGYSSPWDWQNIFLIPGHGRLAPESVPALP